MSWILPFHKHCEDLKLRFYTDGILRAKSINLYESYYISNANETAQLDIVFWTKKPTKNMTKIIGRSRKYRDFYIEDFKKGYVDITEKLYFISYPYEMIACLISS